MTDEHWQAAREAIRHRDFTAAVEHLLAVVEEDDEDAEAFCYLGASYGQLHLFVEAEYYLSRACEIAPKLPHAHYNLGRCYHQRGQIEMAIRSYENALRANKEYGPARAALKELHATLSPDVRGPEDDPEPHPGEEESPAQMEQEH